MYYIESCVACKSKRIIKLYKDVQDRHYRIRGKYTLYKCKKKKFYHRVIRQR